MKSIFFGAVFGIALLSQVSFVNALTISPVRLELKGDSGDRLAGELELFNEEQGTKTYYSSASNFEARGESGTPYFTGGDTDLAAWVSVQEDITLESGQREVVPFTISIPSGAEPGGHFAAIFWGTTPPGTPEAGEVSIGGKLGVLLLLTVSGETEEGGGLLEFSTEEGTTRFFQLPVKFFYRFSNDGDSRIHPEGTITIRNIIGSTAATLDANPHRGNVLPKSVRRYEVVWMEGASEEAEGEPLGFFETAVFQATHFALGRYTAELEFAYGNEGETAQAKFQFWVLPWQLLLVSGFGFLVLLVIAELAMRRYNKLVVSRAEKLPEKQPEQKNE